MVTSPLARINATLASTTSHTLSLHDALPISDTLTATVDDQGNTGSGGPLSDTQTVAISINAVNDAAVLSVPVDSANGGDTPAVITGLSVADVDAGAASVQLTLDVLHGSLSLRTSVAGA